MSVLKYIRSLALLVGALALAACDGTLDPKAPAVASVAVSPAERTLTVGDSVVLQAQARAVDGAVIAGRPVTWSSSDPAIVDVSAAGRAKALAPGRAVVRATIDGKIGSAEVVAVPVPVASVWVDPQSPTIIEGESLQLTATPRGSDGVELPGRVAIWRSDDPNIAEVDASGRVLARRPGRTTIRVTIENENAFAEVTVVKVPVASISIAPGAAVLEVGRTRQYTAVLLDAAGRPLTDRTVVWSVDYPAVAAFAPNGLLYGTGPGYVTVTAMSEGKSMSVAATVVNGEPDEMPYDLIYHRSTPQALGEIIILGTAVGSRPVVLNAGNVSRMPTARPDGQRVAFYVSQIDLATNRQIDDIFAVDRNGMNMKRLTDAEGIDDQPKWSPAGDRIAYRHLDVTTGRSSIWIMNGDGSGKQNLTGELPSTTSVGEPAWSPDGMRIAFRVMEGFGPAASFGIWSMRADGSDKQQHTTSANGFDQLPTWSPDGTRIAFIRAYPGNENDISIVSVSTGHVTRIELPGRQWAPAWSPDGRHFAFYQPIGFAGATAIYTARVDGSNVRLHTLDPNWGGGYAPAWIRR